MIINYIYLILKKKNKYNDKPIELLHLDDNLCNKCLFLINGLLKTGSRKCIVYLKNKNECDNYKYIFREIMDKYHYYKLWIETIISNTSYIERNNILNEFQKNEEDEIIKIILSIRILDEGIDIPKCDSIFISYVGDYNNDIRNIQRICRGNRIDDLNISKITSVFIWCDDINKSLNTLNLIKNNELSKYININCFTENEIFDIKCNLLFNFCNENKRCIYKNEYYKKYNLGYWYNIQKLNIKNGNIEIYEKLKLNNYINENLKKFFKLENSAGGAE